MLDYNLSILGTVIERRTFAPTKFSNPRGREVESEQYKYVLIYSEENSLDVFYTICIYVHILGIVVFL